MASWKLAMNSVTIKQSPLEEAIEVTSRTGYDGFGFWSKDLREYESQGRDIDSVSDILRSSGLDACELLAVRKWHELPLGEFDAARDELVSVFELATRIGAPIVTSPAGRTSHSEDDWLTRLREVDQVSSSYDLTIALEFIHGRNIPDLTAALDVVRSAGTERLGVLLDFFHFHRSESSLKELSSCSPDEISLVHVDDVAEKPLDSLNDRDRRFPGDGVLPMGDFFAALRDISYEGYFSIEIFNDEYWQMDPLTVAKTAYDRTRSLMKT